MSKPKYSIIIPTKNEEKAIGSVIDDIPSHIRKNSEVIVPDASNDATPTIAKKHGAIVLKQKKDGKGFAMRLAARNSKGSVLIFLDGDGTDPPSFIPKLIKKLEKSDMVLGSRTLKNFKQDDILMRELFKIYGVVLRSFFYIAGFKAWADPLAGFRAIRKKDWDKLKLKSNDFTIEAEMNMKALNNNFKIDGVPIPHLKRGGGLINSKFIMNPVMWIKVMNVVLQYVKDDKIKSKLKNFKNVLSTDK